MSDKYIHQARYNKKNTVQFTLRLNRKTDVDLLDALEGKKPQTEIKRLMRLALDKED